jgi:hypothetical protein
MLLEMETLDKPPTDTVVHETKRFIAAGKSGVVYELDAERVLKEYHDPDA